MRVANPPTEERFVRKLIASGKYDSDSEVVRAGLRLLRKHEDLETYARDFQAAVRAGWEQCQEGRVVDGETAFSRLRRRSALRKKPRQA